MTGEPPPESDPRKTSFLSILLYTLGFTSVMALLAALAVWLLRLLSR